MPGNGVGTSAFRVHRWLSGEAQLLRPLLYPATRQQLVEPLIRPDRPAASTYPDFGADYILVMRRDEFGVERIQLHDLGAPRGASE